MYKRLSSKLKDENQQIPWKMIAGTRDHLIHGYFGTNIDIVWAIACEVMGKHVVSAR